MSARNTARAASSGAKTGATAGGAVRVRRQAVRPSEIQPATKGGQQRFKNRLTGSNGSSNRSSGSGGSKLRWDYGLEPTMKKKSKSRPVDYIPSWGMNADGTPLGGNKR